MSARTHVPADDDAPSVIDLVEDCREVSGVLAPYLPTEAVLRLREAQGARPVAIDASVATGVGEGWGDY